MMKGGLNIISCGSNVPFSDKEIFFGNIGEFADKKISVIPDFIANCGMARAFAYLMNTNSSMTDTAIFEDTSETIMKALKKIYEINSSKLDISKTALEIALKKLL